MTCHLRVPSSLLPTYASLACYVLLHPPYLLAAYPIPQNWFNHNSRREIFDLIIFTLKQFSSKRAIRCPPGMPMPSDGLLPPHQPAPLPPLMTSLLLSPISANALCLYMQSLNAVGSHLDLVCYCPLASKWPALILFDNLYAPPTSTNHHLPMLHYLQ